MLHNYGINNRNIMLHVLLSSYIISWPFPKVNEVAAPAIFFDFLRKVSLSLEFLS